MKRWYIVDDEDPSYKEDITDTVLWSYGFIETLGACQNVIVQLILGTHLMRLMKELTPGAVQRSRRENRLHGKLQPKELPNPQDGLA